MKKKHEPGFFGRETKNIKDIESNRYDPDCPIRRADKSRGFSQKASSQFQQRIKDEVKEALDDIRNESAYKFN
ncbi:hypothetical protein [Legionella pneumophila]|uniref:hypothetical protein n=1 Tax=Legionella pneumophila TaxID=446 RepID=UPI0022B548BC|nr:hypothetical protein [Legionella pneumophila]MCZ4740427.1 hypothetical protein [Legionella pneumophila]